MENGHRTRGSEWWRFGDYEIVDGTHIAPKRGVQWESYDPFEGHEEFWGGRRKRNGRQPPYVELAQLDLDDPDELLGWCTRYGLLGILSHRTLALHLWPEWRRSPVSVGSGLGIGPLSRSGTGGSAIPVQRHYRPREGVDPRETDAVGSGVARTDREDGELLTRYEMEEVFATPVGRQSLIPPGADVVDLTSSELRQVDLVAGYAQFFPRYDGVPEWVAWHAWEEDPWADAHPEPWKSRDELAKLRRELEQRAYPAPDSYEFLFQYSEPLHLFRQYAEHFRQMLDLWSGLEDLPGVGSEEELWAWLEERCYHTGVWGGSIYRGFLTALQAISPSLVASYDRETGRVKWERRWAILSLFAGLNAMMLQDLPLGSGLVKLCANCDRRFVTDNERQRYCSDRCQKTAQQRGRRARRKAEH